MRFLGWMGGNGRMGGKDVGNERKYCLISSIREDSGMFGECGSGFM